ncbi:TIGR03618 family F420-dependent PPOX class oxidoreductase [Streptomyces sp. GMY02]|uniref:TIGR03618 family F420-dependent PPOX class oxidoreductase n=1 Tax=Streptomyces sp. GMY02 TaxID=1333528 RepID=UPI001C2BA687|nr:TIGR03618 family F420-dependent PPOX class oxidoreductase [Streptomyces sp. GMY02]QXE38268.1 TIGR03618 family F420-dependent PPOX class oxidoreductase [Streptomyces sp. GMY02]
MTTLDDFDRLLREQRHLAVVSTLRADQSIHSSVVNLAVMPHPTTGTPVAAFVTYGRVKLANLRARPQLTVTARSGWTWAAHDGTAELIGPDDPHPAFDAEGIRLLLREIYTAAGGIHDDWQAYDRTMAQERRTAVLVRPHRTYGVIGADGASPEA